MTGRRGFSDLVAKMEATHQACIEGIAKKLRADMNLTQLREARSLSQAALGEILHVEQPAVAKFLDRDVRIRNFRDLGKGDE